jgi:SAM-dependent methyltransferase
VGEHEVLLRTLREALVGTCDSVLDVGCGFSASIQPFSHLIPRTVGVDSSEQALERSRAAGVHREYHQMDLLKVGGLFGPRSFDAAIAIGTLEHFDKPDGYRLLELLESIARKRVIVCTPNGFRHHRSGWEVYDFELRGYCVTGLSGWRPLRGADAHPRIRPHSLGGLLSRLTGPFATRFPGHAYGLMAVRDMEAS